MGYNAYGSYKYTRNIYVDDKNLFIDILDKRVVVLLDIILIYSNITEEHFKLLFKIFTCLHQYEFYCKLKKCSFLWSITIFPGFDTILEGMCISGAKVRSPKKWLATIQ